MEKHKPVRMCVVCRGRFYQSDLNRLQCRDAKLTPFTGFGRSFYVCNGCFGDKKMVNYVSKLCKITKEKAKEEIFRFPLSILN